MISYSRIDQSTAGTSALPEADYLNNPRLNLTPISYREVQAMRASVAWEHLRGSTLISITPFARWNEMEMLPNWSLTYDPVISRTGHASGGALLKVRRDMAPIRLRAIAGLDVDYSPGTHTEWRIQATREDGAFTDFVRGDAVYDYDVTFRSISPYVQFEATPVAQVRVVAGLRYDLLGYDYDNPLGELTTGSHRRPGSTTVGYEHLSPKLGIVWAPADAFRIFGSYGHGFRAPSEGQLFRQGRSLSTIGLRPVRADNVEIGAAGVIASRLSYDIAAYSMRKRDDLLTYTRPDGANESVNAGETLHRGVELGVALALPLDLRLDVGFSRAEHTYEEWLPRDDTDYSGNTMESAPSRTLSAALMWSPARWDRASAGIDVSHIGPYWMDAANTTRYDGHTIVTLRAEAPVSRHVSVFGQMTNALGARYAELAQFTAARGAEFAPGMARALYIGARFH
jgi:outer membrane receptor protein involved in Fe transport